MAYTRCRYFNLDSFVNVYTVPHSSYTIGRSRTSQLGTSCTTMGAPNTFFTKQPAAVVLSQRPTDTEEPNWVLIIVLGAVAVVMCGLVVVMVKKEREGSPLFAVLVPEAEPPGFVPQVVVIQAVAVDPGRSC